MMYPVLAKVRYDELGTVTRTSDAGFIVGYQLGDRPLVMFILAWLMLPTCPRTGPADHRRPGSLHRHVLI